MADYSKTRGPPGAVYPENAVATESSRLEPLLTPDLLITRYLVGIPLVSQIIDPVTKKRMVMTPAMVADIIETAIADLELECFIDIRPVQRKEKHAFDRNHFECFGYFKLEHRPCSSIEQLSITPANNIDIYKVPLDWVETAYLLQGQVNLIPWTLSIDNSMVAPSQAYQGAAYLSAFSQLRWIPAHWQIIYTSGFKDNMVPRVINSLIGVEAAMQILSQLGATYSRTNSHSLSLDGGSQSVSGPGPNIYATRISDLEKKKEALKNKFKAIFGMKIFSSHV